MDWSNEEYVRVYTRETADDLDLSWHALALWRALLVKFDRSGLVAARNGWLSVSRMTRIPLDVVESAGPELLRDGRLQQIAGGYFAPNFVDAQTANKSDKARQKESRVRRRADAVAQVVNKSSAETGKRHEASHDVTQSHAPVTRSHTESRGVTLCSALLCDPSASLDSALLPVTPAAPVNLQGPTQGSFAALTDKVDDAVREIERGSSKKPKRPLVADWRPARTEATKEAEAQALARGVDLAHELARMRDWATANSERKADWDATWRNWTRSAKPTHRPSGPGDALQRQLDRVRQLEAEERAQQEDSDDAQ